MYRSESLLRVAKTGCAWEGKSRGVNPKGTPLNLSRTKIPKTLPMLSNIRLVWSGRYWNWLTAQSSMSDTMPIG
jgi:hypothetical protein